MNSATRYWDMPTEYTYYTPEDWEL